jgi:hypothetical protein
MVMQFTSDWLAWQVGGAAEILEKNLHKDGLVGFLERVHWTGANIYIVI